MYYGIDEKTFWPCSFFLYENVRNIYCDYEIKIFSREEMLIMINHYGLIAILLIKQSIELLNIISIID